MGTETLQLQLPRATNLKVILVGLQRATCRDLTATVATGNQDLTAIQGCRGQPRLCPIYLVIRLVHVIVTHPHNFAPPPPPPPQRHALALSHPNGEKSINGGREREQVCFPSTVARSAIDLLQTIDNARQCSCVLALSPASRACRKLPDTSELTTFNPLR